MPGAYGGHTTADGDEKFVAGGRASRTYRRAYRPPDGLSGNFDDLGPLAAVPGATVPISG